MCELAARHLLEHRLEGLMIANRSAEKAQELTKQFLGDVACEVLSLESMMSRLHDADIIIASTSSPETLIQEEHVREAMRYRKNRSMFFIDLGVPRNIDPSVNNIMNVFLFDIDDLQQVVDDNLDERQKAASEAEKIIREEVGLLDTYLAERDMTPVIRELVDQFNSIRRGEMEKLYRKLPDLNGNERDVIEQYTEGMMKKVLHPTLHWLKEAPKEGDPREKIDLIRSLFRLK
jgi:glutamyl-tRNA reductase